jgi:hypothetical protein
MRPTLITHTNAIFLWLVLTLVVSSSLAIFHNCLTNQNRFSTTVTRIPCFLLVEDVSPSF